MMQPDDPRLHLCVVTDDLRDGIDGLVRRMEAAERGGATMVLLRLKHADARTLVEAGHALVRGLGIPVLVRDRLDVAMICGAAGVHLTIDSMPVPAIRLVAPPGMIVGASVSSVDDLAQIHDADFVTVGPVFGRGNEDSDLAGFVALMASITAPVVAVGGLTPDRRRMVHERGASGVMLMQLPDAAREVTTCVAAFRSSGGDVGGNDTAPDHVG